MTRQAKIITMLLATALACISAPFILHGSAFLLLIRFLNTAPEKTVPFDPNLWKRDTEAAFFDANHIDIFSATRDLMVDDLLKQHRIVGMHREDIIALLGQPDISRSLPSPERDLIYWLGPDSRGPFGGLDSLWLVVKCDPNGVVTACQKMCD